jgi:hypothetical protein
MEFTNKEDTLPLENIYKFCKVNSSGTKTHALIFSGNSETKQIDELFDDLEITNMKLNNTHVQFSDQSIHKDDTIQTIKHKILKELGIDNHAYENLYLYAKSSQYINLWTLYHTITQNDVYPLTQSKFGQLLIHLNVSTDFVADIPIKTSYSYQDLLQFFKKNEFETDIYIPIGQKFASIYDYLFSGNPHDLSAYSPEYAQNSANPLYLYEQSLLFTYGELKNKEIYYIELEDMIEHTNVVNISEEMIIKNYFPLLIKQHIVSQSLFEEKKLSLIETYKTTMFQPIEQYVNIQEAMYSIYQSRSEELQYISKGIHEFDMIIHPVRDMQMPLDIVFKNIHASKDIPFIKYNPGMRRENLYRIYSETIATNGSKIPYLKEPSVHSLSKEIGKPKTIAFYINTNDDNYTSVVMELHKNGDMFIKCMMKNLITSDAVNLTITPLINHIIRNMNTFLEQIGYQMKTIQNVYDSRIEFQNIDVQCEFDIKKDLHLKKSPYVHCITRIFDIITGDMNKGYLLNYKKVNNYRKMDAIEALITNVYNNTNSDKEVIDALKLNHNMEQDEAIKHFTDFLNNFTQINGEYVNKTTQIVENPGFRISLRPSVFENKFTIMVTGINNMNYIEPLFLNIDTLLRITQQPDTTAFQLEQLSKMCKKSTKTGEIPNENLVVTVQPIIKPVVFQSEPEEKDDDEDDEGFFYVSEEEDDDDDEEDTQEGGAIKQKKLTLEKKPTERVNKLFFDKKKKLEPDLFLTKAQGQYKNYSRVCPVNLNLQPIILTDEEKQKLDRENRQAYKYAIRYGTTPDKKYWYICPRYWCLKTNEALSEEQVKQGVCEGNIHEFTEDRFHKDKDQKYKWHNPGFKGKDAHPTSCLPCCYGKDWNADQLKNRRKECGITKEDISIPDLEDNGDEENGDEEGDQKRKDKTKEVDDEEEDNLRQVLPNLMYVVGPDKFPLANNRSGFLSKSIQQLLNIDYADVIMPTNSALIKPNTSVILRSGIEQTQHQSFLGCIANIYSSYHNLIYRIASIEEIQHILAKSISIDDFIKYQNGTLSTTFMPKNRVKTDIYEKYEKSELYKELDMTNKTQENFFKDTVSAFENFKTFLTDKDAWVDHTYLWDIVTTPNPKLFKNGLNLVIIQTTDNDITDNVEFICPTNSYTNTYYDPSRETILLVKQNDFYEPIYFYRSDNRGQPLIHMKPFLSDTNMTSQFVNLLRILQTDLTNKCKNLPSMPKTYHYKENIPAETVIDFINEYQYHVIKQVSNYKHKTIGLLVKIYLEHEDEFFIPTLPSKRVRNLPVTYMDQLSWAPYESTKNFLNRLSTETDGAVFSKPIMRVEEDEMIVGILTETNQFVQIVPPIANTIEDELQPYKTMNYSNGEYYRADVTVTTEKTEDAERIASIKNISLENKFYTAFRTTVRMLLNDYENYELKQKLVGLLDSPNIFYQLKLKKLVILLRVLLKKRVAFGTMSQSVLDNMSEIYTCMSDCKDKTYCLSKNDECKLIVPKKNLVNQVDNQLFYYGRLADELIRFKRVRLFLLDNNKYLNYTDTDYQINDNEALLLQTALDSENLNKLQPFQTNKYLQYIDHDNATPSIVEMRYSNLVTLKERKQACIQTIMKLTGPAKSFWKTVFPKDTQEIIYKSEVDCGYIIMHELFLRLRKNIPSVYDMKKRLVQLYKPLMESHGVKILHILGKQNKKEHMIQQVVNNQVSLETLVMSDQYYLTDLDLWILCDFYKLPVLLVTDTSLESLGLNVPWLVLGGNKNVDVYYCVRSPKQDNLPGYQLINYGLGLGKLDNFRTLLDDPEYAGHALTIGSYLDTYSMI